MGDSRGPVRWLRNLTGRGPRPHESVSWEIEHHLAELVDRLVEEGWAEGDARREAERRFGDRDRYGPPMRRMERGRVAMERRTMWWDFVKQGLGGAARTARRYPGFTAGVVLTLALGIGANATMYGIIDRLLLQPPDHVVEPERVKRVMVERPSSLTGRLFAGSTLTYPDYADLKAHGGFASVAAYQTAREQTVGAGESATRAMLAMASAEFFGLLGVETTIGRFFTPEEGDGRESLTAVISEEYWRRAYAGDPDALGQSLEIYGLRHQIVGVVRAGFTGMDLQAVDIWLPLEATQRARSPEGGCIESRGCWWMQAVARLADGVTLEAAEAEATSLHLNGRREEIERERYPYPKEARIVLASVIAAEGPDASDETQVAKWLAGVSAIVLLIAAANVANLLLARGTRRRRETAVRLAMGVSRSRLTGTATVESVALALAGGAAALVIARWGGGFVRSALLPGVYFPDAAVNGRVLLFTLLVSVLAGLLAGIGPSLQGSRADVAGDLVDASRGSSGSRSRLRSFLTVAQASLSVVLLVGAGLFVKSLGELRGLDLGMDVDRLLLSQIEFRDPDLPDERRSALYEEAARRLAALPSVESVGLTGVPFQWATANSIEVPGWDSLPNLPGGGPYYYGIDEGYFATLGLAVLRGRSIERSDVAGSQRVAVVNETMARTLWPDGEALGRCLLLDQQEECTTVVGVVEDAARGGYQDEEYMGYYLPLPQQDTPPRGLYVRAAGAPDDAIGEVAPLLRSFSADVRFATVRSLEEILDPQARAWTLGATMFTVFGLLALTLAAIGLYSVLAFDVAQRTREIGIRTALGAERSRLLRTVIVDGGRFGLAGVVLGLGAAYLAAPYAEEMLFQVSPRDPVVLLGVAVALALVAVAASVVPGMRATRVDPVVALRTE